MKNLFPLASTMSLTHNKESIEVDERLARKRSTARGRIFFHIMRSILSMDTTCRIPCNTRLVRCI